jgi:predicted alpha/beta superfamily hydrolase
MILAGAGPAHRPVAVAKPPSPLIPTPPESRMPNQPSLAPLAAVALALALALAAPRASPESGPAAARPPAGIACRSTVSGDLRLHRLRSRIFGNTRTLRVLLPAGYDAPENRGRRYPVLYLLDGQNLFDACLSDVSHREWGVDETVDRLIAERVIPPLIVVGIDHAGKDRAREYLPYKDYVGNPGMAEPAGKRFPDFLTDEVMPVVEARYRTLPGHANTGIGGSSYGGVAALYALLAKPRVFGYGLIESPTMWIGMGQLVRDTGPLAAMPVRVYFGFGGREGDDPRMVERMTALIRIVEANFRAAGYDDTNFRFVVDPEAAHNEDAWAKRLPAALTFLFGAWREPGREAPDR